MATIRKEVSVNVSPDRVWDALRDVGALHTRLVPGFVTDCKLEDGARIVTFANGVVAREVIVTIDEERRRLASSARSERLAHHNASFQVIPEGAGCRLLWIADVLPAEAAVTVGAMMEDGVKAAKRALDALVAA